MANLCKFFGIFMILVLIGLVIAIIFLNKKRLDTPTVVEPKITADIKNAAASFPSKQTFAPTFTFSEGAIVLGPPGFDPTKDSLNNFAMDSTSAVADIYTVKIPFIIQGSSNFFVTLEEYAVIDYLSISNFQGVVSIPEIKANEPQTVGAPFLVGGAPVAKPPVSATVNKVNIDLSGGLSETNNVIKAQVGIIGSGNIYFKISYGITPRA